MRTIPVLFLLCCNMLCFAQNKAVIEQIDKKCVQIGGSVNSFFGKTVDDYKTSIGLGDVTGYYKEGKLQMIVVEYYGKVNKAQTEYYFDNNELIFVYKEDTFTSGPLEGKYEVEVLYFNNKKLIKWVNKEEQEVPPASKEFLKQEIDEQKEVQRLIKLLK